MTASLEGARDLRDGTDLLVELPSGVTLRVRDFFDTESIPAAVQLVALDGSTLPLEISPPEKVSSPFDVEADERNGLGLFEDGRFEVFRITSLGEGLTVALPLGTDIFGGRDFGVSGRLGDSMAPLSDGLSAGTGIPFLFDLVEPIEGRDDSIVTVLDPLEAQDDVYAVSEDTTLSVAEAAGVLANDTVIDGEAITVTSFSGPSVSGGSVSLGSDGSFTYTPSADFTGTDS